MFAGYGRQTGIETTGTRISTCPRPAPDRRKYGVSEDDLRRENPEASRTEIPAEAWIFIPQGLIICGPGTKEPGCAQTLPSPAPQYRRSRGQPRSEPTFGHEFYSYFFFSEDIPLQARARMAGEKPWPSSRIMEPQPPAFLRVVADQGPRPRGLDAPVCPTCRLCVCKGKGWRGNSGQEARLASGSR